jgi:hypothetical protein
LAGRGSKQPRPFLFLIHPSAWNVDSQKFHRIARLHCYTSRSAAYRLESQSDWSSKERYLYKEAPR